MTTEEVRALLKAVPFRPFHVVMKDGRRIFIDDPFYAKHTPGTDRVVFSPHGETFWRLKIPEMERIELDAPTPA